MTQAGRPTQNSTAQDFLLSVHLAIIQDRASALYPEGEATSSVSGNEQCDPTKLRSIRRRRSDPSSIILGPQPHSRWLLALRCYYELFLLVLRWRVFGFNGTAGDSKPKDHAMADQPIIATVCLFSPKSYDTGLLASFNRHKVTFSADKRRGVRLLAHVSATSGKVRLKLLAWKTCLYPF